MKLKINIQGKEYEVKIEEIDKKKTKIEIGGENFIFEKKEKTKENFSIAKTSFPKRNFETKEIKAPIAGTITEIFVKENEFVKKGKKVVLLSAMKMENEIISDFEGKVKKIFVEKEEMVKEGHVLIALD